jgi:hypothetical protein
VQAAAVSRGEAVHTPAHTGLLLCSLAYLLNPLVCLLRREADAAGARLGAFAVGSHMGIGVALRGSR